MPDGRPSGRGRDGISLIHGALAICLLAGLLATPLRAVIFFSTADVDFNTTAPTGPLAGSGWQWVGHWGNFQAVPIGPRHFITARHIGGTMGDALVLHGVSYPTIASFEDTVSDLRIWEISGTFPAWAPLYRGGSEVGRRLVVSFSTGRAGWPASTCSQSSRSISSSSS